MVAALIVVIKLKTGIFWWHFTAIDGCCRGGRQWRVADWSWSCGKALACEWPMGLFLRSGPFIGVCIR